jgi:hypothetical protein
MYLYSCFCVFITLIAVTFAEKSNSDELVRLSRGNPLVILSDKNFSLAQEATDIHVFVLFTSKAASPKCPLCEPFEAVLKSLARASWSLESKQKLFFAIADLAHNQKTFKEFGIQTVPEFAYFGPLSTRRIASLVTYAGVVSYFYYSSCTSF